MYLERSSCLLVLWLEQRKVDAIDRFGYLCIAHVEMQNQAPITVDPDIRQKSIMLETRTCLRPLRFGYPTKQPHHESSSLVQMKVPRTVHIIQRQFSGK